VTSSPLDPHAQPDCARTRGFARVAALALAGATVLGASAAHAIDCVDLPNAVIGIGGSAPNALVDAVAKVLATAPTPINLVYASPGACKAMEALVPSGGRLKPLAEFTGVTFNYYDVATAKKTACTIPVGSDTVADWGSMAQLAGTCSDPATSAPYTLPESVGDFIGPITGLSLIVPTTSTEFSISAEAIYYIYGLGVASGGAVPPWTEQAAIATRAADSAVGLLIAKATNIPLRSVGYLSQKGNQEVVDYVAAVQNVNAGLGFVSTEIAETKANAAKVRTLAFKAYGQDYAYFPSSTATATDKKNLREGRYFLWNPHHFYARKEKLTEGSPLQKVINIFTSKEEIPGSQSFLDLQISVGTVPGCAMKVGRDGDVGPLFSFKPEHSCSNYYDFKTTGSTTAKKCTVATVATDCGATGFECNVGYCEVK
jgi:hypothetical protein